MDAVKPKKRERCLKCGVELSFKEWISGRFCFICQRERERKWDSNHEDSGLVK